jgi:hypothetical protein
VLKRAGAVASELWHLPQVLNASYDLSAPLRQGLVLSVSRYVKAIDNQRNGNER